MVSDCEKILRGDKSDAVIFYLKASTLNGLGYPSKAIGPINAAIGLDSGDAEFFLVRGLINARMKKFDEAIIDFDEAARLDVGLANYAYSGLAAVHVFMQKNYVLGMQDMNRLLLAYPDYIPALWSRAALNWIKGDMQEALSDIGKAIQRARVRDKRSDNLSDLLIFRGKMLLSQAKWALALVDFDAVLGLDDENWEALLGHAVAKLQLGDPGPRDALVAEGLKAEFDPDELRPDPLNIRVLIPPYAAGCFEGRPEFDRLK